MTITRRSAKAKGKRLQNTIVDLFKSVFYLSEDQVRSVASCVNGEDIIFSSDIQSKLNISVECKNQEKLNIWSALEQTKDNCKTFNPVLIFKRNKSKTYVTIEVDYFMELLDNSLTGDYYKELFEKKVE